jgi:peptidoglycan/LPS O-acetylase OafA/YrhL
MWPLKEQATARTPRFYLPELDALRFFAFLAVFLGHSFNNTAASHYPETHQDLRGALVSTMAGSGGYGVDLFFALSAFLITQLLLREQNLTGTLEVRRFYLRRILRIWPLYFCFLSVVATIGIWFRQPIHTPAKWMLMYLLLSGNFAYALWGWAPSLATSQLWSIALEEQFYLLWPLFVRGRCRRQLIAAALAMVVVSVAARAICWLVSAPAPLVWTNTLTRLDPIAGGILLGVWTMDKTPKLRSQTRAILMASGILTMFVVSTFCHPGSSPNTAVTLFFGYPAVTLGCLAILVSVLGVKVHENRLMARAGIYLGQISYGLYVWHFLALLLTLKGLSRAMPFAGDWIGSSIFEAICALGLTIAISAASYRFLEMPFLKLKSRFAMIPSRPTWGISHSEAAASFSRTPAR